MKIDPLVSILAAKPRGWKPEEIIGEWVKHQALDELFSLAPAGILGSSGEALEALVDRKRDELARNPSAWDSVKSALRKVEVEGGQPGHIKLGFDSSTHAVHQVIMGILRDKSLAWLGAEPPEVLAWASHSFGINLTVISADQKLLIGRRSSKTASFHGLLHCTVNEAMEPKDMDRDGNPSVGAAFQRGLIEELGVNKPLDPIRITALFVTNQLEWAVSGHLISSLTAAEIVAAHNMAEDGWEAEMLVIENKVEALLERLRSEAWVPFGALTTVLAASASLGRAAAERLLPELERYCGLSNLTLSGLVSRNYPLVPVPRF